MRKLIKKCFYTIVSSLNYILVPFFVEAWQQLHEGLGKIKVIRGSLTISRSFPITTLDFFEDLEMIKGIHVDDRSSDTRKNYALELTENENLQMLFPEASERKNNKSVIIRSQKGDDGPSEPGSASIHYNPKLCKQEIEKLLKYSRMAKAEAIDISPTNGGKGICSENTLDVQIDAYAVEADLFIENYQKYLYDLEVDPRQLLKYEIHYREISKITYKMRNLTKHGKRDACGGSDWKIADHKPSDGIIIDHHDQTITWTREQSLLRPLKPYTHYALYVTTMIGN